MDKEENLCYDGIEFVSLTCVSAFSIFVFVLLSARHFWYHTDNSVSLYLSYKLHATNVILKVCLVFVFCFLFFLPRLHSHRNRIKSDIKYLIYMCRTRNRKFMWTMSGSASFNPSYEVASMRQPLGKNKGKWFNFHQICEIAKWEKWHVYLTFVHFSNEPFDKLQNHHNDQGTSFPFSLPLFGWISAMPSNHFSNHMFAVCLFSAYNGLFFDVLCDLIDIEFEFLPIEPIKMTNKNVVVPSISINYKTIEFESK